MSKLELKLPKVRLSIGRAPGNDHVIEHPLVAGAHAQLLRRGTSVVLRDLGSMTGTFVNGTRIAAAVFVRPGDLIQIGPAQLELTEGGEVEAEDLRLSARLDVVGLCYDVGRPPRTHRLLREVSFSILPGELVALMGPAGAGKTTLIENVNGYLQPTAGRVLINGVDLHRSFDSLRGHIGYVPQEDIVHRKLTVYEACYFTAQMRMKWTDEALIEQRIAAVLAKLDILHLANRTIGSPEARVLSGGQRKRLNLAMEMVTDPALLFLDEPTSGLSSADALGVMRALSELKEAGRTIIVTIHQPSREIYEMMDNVVLLGAGGRLVYYGPVAGAYDHFRSAPNPDALFEKLSSRTTSDDDWKVAEAEYRETEWYREYVAERATGLEGDPRPAPRPRATREVGIGQLWLLLERLSKLYTRDVGWLIGALLGAPALMLFLTGQLSGESNRHTLLFVAALLAYFFGIFPAIEMIQSEMTIFRRERMVNLKLPSYLASKLVFLGVFGLLQALSISAILVWYEGAELALHRSVLILASVQLCGAATGLFVSTISRTNKVAMMLMLACVIIMIAFSGFVVSLPALRDDGRAWLLAISPMRWGLGALMEVTTDVPYHELKHLGFDRESWVLNLFVNLALAALPAAVTLFVLRLRDDR